MFFANLVHQAHRVCDRVLKLNGMSWDVSDTVFPETLCVAASFAVLLPAAQETAQQHLNDKHESVDMFK